MRAILECRVGIRSPFAVLALTVGAIFLTEVGVMFAIPRGLPPLLDASLDAAALVAVLLPLLLLLVVGPMSERIAEAARAGEGLREARDRLEERVQERTAEVDAANRRLRESVEELERGNRDAALLAEMSDLVHGCTAVEEVHRVVERMGPRIFPGASGALFIFSPSRDDLDAVVRWGDRAAALGERVLEPARCWALRRGRVGRGEELCSGSPCLAAGGGFLALCVPMIAQAETLGMLHVQVRCPDAAARGGARSDRSERLATAAAGQLASALTNLRLRDALRSASIRDPLTGLYNRRYMEETLARELRRAERSGRPLAVLMLDLDHFKRFNDTFGHEAGDALLREIAGVLGESIRGGDVACRYGGEELLVILPECPLEAACARAEALRQGIAGLTVHHLGRPLGAVTASLGVAVFPDHGPDLEALLRAADGALYEAKQAGRNRLVLAGARAEPGGISGTGAA